MRTTDLFRFAGSAFRGHRLRTALTVTGVAIGIAAVIMLTALGEGARRYVVAEFASLGTNLVIVVPGKVETTGAIPVGGVTNDLTLDDLHAIERVPGVERAAPLATGTGAVQYRGRSRQAAVIGTTAEFRYVRRLTVGAGRFLTPEGEGSGAEIVLGAKVAHELFGADNPLGAPIRIGGWRFRVVGVLAPHGRALGFDVDDLVLIPVRTALQMFNRPSLFRIFVEGRPSADLSAVEDGVHELLIRRHRADDVTIVTQDAVRDAFASILDVLTLTLAGIASVSLSVAGIGIMNVMLVSVTERRAEIGLLKALGASSRQVLAAFLAEAVLLSSVGGLVGVGVGLAATALARRLYPVLPATAPVWAIVAALATALGVGVVFGAWPARSATRLDPVAALARR